MAVLSCCCAARTSSVERVAAGARTAGVRVVDRETLLLDGVDEVDGGALDVGSTHPVDSEVDAVELLDEVPVDGTVVEEQLVSQSRTAARLHRYAQRQVVPALLLQQRLGLGRGSLSHDHTMCGGGLVLDAHGSPSTLCCWSCNR